ncbi:hypothetical protein [Prosthecobacter dejongeii]|uniref:YHS domain-containing protein n=1 Tax=Prosthecobacter dejongeii TaxID=48465 RepID=A0A7W8DPC1_9BACT|nr:hypothetical protein [Prosthecobacter dejongeii]MBB5037489.1 hypothetical protein [Prosthecobacter dejongeii]
MKALLPILLLTCVSLTAVFAKGGPPINDVCPVDGKAARVIYRIFEEKGPVIFCCATCLDTYRKNPNRFTVKPKAEK